MTPGERLAAQRRLFDLRDGVLGKAPARIQPKPRMPWSSMVATTAMSMPAALTALARTAVRGWLRPLRPRMKRTEAAR